MLLLADVERDGVIILWLRNRGGEDILIFFRSIGDGFEERFEFRLVFYGLEFLELRCGRINVIGAMIGDFLELRCEVAEGQRGAEREFFPVECIEQGIDEVFELSVLENLRTADAEEASDSRVDIRAGAVKSFLLFELRHDGVAMDADA